MLIGTRSSCRFSLLVGGLRTKAFPEAATVTSGSGFSAKKRKNVMTRLKVDLKQYGRDPLEH